MNPIQTIREGLENFTEPYLQKALAALAELEKQEPVAWCPALTYPGHEKDRAWANGKPRKEDIEYWALNGKGITYAYAAPAAQQPQARTDFTDEWTGYLKDGETPFERFLRERKDLDALTKLYQRALEENERLKAQQPQAECRSDGRCQYAIDHGAEGLGHCPKGKCVLPEQPQAEAAEVFYCKACGCAMQMPHDDCLACERGETQQAETAPLFGEGHIEAAAKKMAEIFDYPWDFMPEKGRNTMRENVRAVLDAALAAAPKGQP